MDWSEQMQLHVIGLPITCHSEPQLVVEQLENGVHLPERCHDAVCGVVQTTEKAVPEQGHHGGEAEERIGLEVLWE